jgi:hypothetical protein
MKSGLSSLLLDASCAVVELPELKQIMPLKWQSKSVSTFFKAKENFLEKIMILLSYYDR